jgi:hypothetical protein
MKIFTLAVVALAFLGNSTAFAAGPQYEVTFQGETPIVVAVPDQASNKVQLDSLKMGDKDAGPKGYVGLQKVGDSLVVDLYWWQGHFEELTDGKGSHLSLPIGVCKQSKAARVTANLVVTVDCSRDRPPYEYFDAVTVRRLN